MSNAYHHAYHPPGMVRVNRSLQWVKTQDVRSLTACLYHLEPEHRLNDYVFH